MMQEPTGTQRPWLKPSEALNRFEPPPAVEQPLTEEIERLDQARVRFGFRVGNIGLLIGQTTNSEVMDPPPIFPLPATPEWLRGLINLRGNLAPVFDLKRLLGLKEDTEGKQMLLLLDEGEAMVGMLIDGLPRSEHLERKLKRQPPLPEVLKDYVPEAYVHEGTFWLEFNHRGFFGSLAARMST